MIFGAIVVAFWISKKISKPFWPFSQNAERLATGDYSVRFGGLWVSGAQQRGVNLDIMADRVQETFGSLRPTKLNWLGVIFIWWKG